MENERRDISKNRIEVLRMVEFLQDEIDRAKKVPFSDKVMVDKEVMTNLIDDIIKNLPEDFNTAQYVLEEKDRIIEDAHNEYKKIKEEANEVMRNQVNNHNIVREAEIKAKRIVSEADASAKDLSMRAKEYVEELFMNLDNQLLQKRNEVLMEMNKSFETFTAQVQGETEYLSNELKANVESLRKMK